MAEEVVVAFCMDLAVFVLDILLNRGLVVEVALEEAVFEDQFRWDHNSSFHIAALLELDMVVVVVPVVSMSMMMVQTLMIRNPVSAVSSCASRMMIYLHALRIHDYLENNLRDMEVKCLGHILVGEVVSSVAIVVSEYVYRGRPFRR